MQVISSHIAQPKYILPMFSVVGWYSTSLNMSHSAMVWHIPMAKFYSPSKNPRSVGILFKQKLPSDLWIWLRVCKALWVPLGWKCCKTPRHGINPTPSLVPCKNPTSPRSLGKMNITFQAALMSKKNTRQQVRLPMVLQTQSCTPPAGMIAQISALLPWLCYNAGGCVLMWRYFFHHLYCRRSFIASIWFILLDTPSLWDPSQLLSLSWDISGRRLCFFLSKLSLDWKRLF